MNINPENGSLILPDGQTITAATNFDELQARWPRSELANQLSFSFIAQSRRYTLAAQFDGQRLRQLTLFFCPVGEDLSWENWSESRELQRRRQFDRWLDKQLGAAPCTVKSSAAGRCRCFPWGSVGAYYHPQDGSTRMVLAYG